MFGRLHARVDANKMDLLLLLGWEDDFCVTTLRCTCDMICSRWCVCGLHTVETDIGGEDRQQ